MSMTKIKRGVFLLLAVLLLFSLAACSADTPQQTPEPSPSPSPAPVVTAEPEPTPEPLPDVDISSWEFLLANSYNSIAEYEPPYGGYGGQVFDSRMVNALISFISDARSAGYTAYVAVGHRNYEYLLNHYIYAVRDFGSAEAAAAHRLGPGVNEHQTGLAFDVTEKPQYASYYNDFENEGITDTELYKWMLEHCVEYGFILRYPEGKEEYYGTPCCPGHFRYVGVEAAAYITENELCLEEFLLLYDEDAVYLPQKQD